MNAFAFAARSLIRQPGRSALGILGIAAVGALLFDMLLLSRGLVVSFRDLLDRDGFDIRITATDAGPIGGPRLPHASPIAAEVAALPEVADAVPILMSDAEASHPGGPPVGISLLGIDARSGRHPWTISSGHDLEDVADGAAGELLVNETLAASLKVVLGDEIAIRVRCGPGRAPLPPSTFRVVGVAEFPFDDAVQLSGVVRRARMAGACDADGRDEADMILVSSRQGGGPDAAVSAIRRRRPDVHAATNEQIVARLAVSRFTYFRQISTVLSTITLLFGFLLITVLLTVSVNQRLGEIAAVRALGFSRARVAADVLWQSALLVGIGGLLALPVGAVLSIWLDAILKTMPGIPIALHFFVFEPRSLLLHAILLAVTAVLAAAYPIALVTTLPIATTLRNEVVS
jgi:ABC-type lipoprotein release transport system permease subunit